MAETSYAKCRNLSVKWEFSKIFSGLITMIPLNIKNPMHRPYITIRYNQNQIFLMTFTYYDHFFKGF